MQHQDHVNLIRKAIPGLDGNSPLPPSLRYGRTSRSNKNKSTSPSIWADLGSGEGAFTFALAELLPSGSKIYSIDKNGLSLKAQVAEFRRRFPFFTVEFLQMDFRILSPLTLTLSPKGRGNKKQEGKGLLDGILMANSLHFIQDKVPLLKELKKLLKPDGRIVFVEYNVDEGNTWVPYPFSFTTLKDLAKKSGLSEPKLSGTVSSQFLNEMYCACVLNT